MQGNVIKLVGYMYSNKASYIEERKSTIPYSFSMGSREISRISKKQLIIIVSPT